MSLQDKIMHAIKVAMRAKNQKELTALRSVKSAILLAQTGADQSGKLSENQELKILQRLVKQRKDSADIYAKQGRADLAQTELEEAAVISSFLPKPMSENEIRAVVDKVIEEVDAHSMKDMGKVMGKLSQQLAGKADGKTISIIVKAKLSL